MEKIIIYTDGGCSGNPGPGAWAFVIQKDGQKITHSGSEPATTNNRMELMAVIMALEAVKDVKTPIVLHTDSQYVKKGITEWIKTWLKNGWKTSAREPVKNKDLWINLKEKSDLLPITWQWVMGHAGNPLNEECDQLVKKALSITTGK